MSGTDPRWHVVIPVKPAAIGKSRLQVPGVDREALARAIALDTIDAVTRATRVAAVVVVTDDAEIRAAGPGVVRDPGEGLNAAIATGIDAVRASAGPVAPCAVLLGDIPSLRPADLDAALALAAAQDAPGAVPDADGTGTTLLARASSEILRFGADSFARHLAAGAAALGIPPASTLRHDVDTAAQLEAARALGLGPRTAALLP